MSLIVRVQWTDGRQQMVDTGLDDDEWGLAEVRLRTYTAPDITAWYRHAASDPAPLPLVKCDTVFRRTVIDGRPVFVEVS